MFNPSLEIYFQIGIVAGGITLDQCGAKNYPGVFTSINHPKNLDFIKATVAIQGKNEKNFKIHLEFDTLSN